MIISSSGTTVPGAPTRPEFLKASVYLPPAFIAHHPDLHRHIIDIVQHYIETVGVRTVTMWTQRARRDLHYSLTQIGHARRNALVNEIPTPDYKSSQYTFLGQTYRFIDDPSAIPAAPNPSPAASTASYDFGEDPDVNELTIIDLQQHNSELQDQIHILQQTISDLHERVNATNRRHASVLTALRQRAQERIVFLEGQIQKVCSTTPNTTPWKYNAASPSRAEATQLHTPFGYSTAPKTPETPSRHYTTIHSVSGTPSRLHAQAVTVSRPAQASPSPLRSDQASTSTLLDAIDSDRLAASCVRLLPHYINLYHLGHLSTSLDLISDYTPAENRYQELLKLGLEEDVCEVLIEAMALDEGLN